MGKQAIPRIDSDFEDDFEGDLVLPEGPLSLRLSSKSKGAAAATSASRARSMHGQQQQRPHTAHSDTSSISGSSSIIFSTSSSESNATASESEDQMCDISARLLQHARTTATTVTSRGGHALDNGQQDTSEEDEDDDDDERSYTLKANQLPTDFAEQLALSKAQAALAKGFNPTPTDTTSNSHAGTHSSTDWEEDIVFNSSSSLNTSRILSKKASFTSHISDSGSVHSRSSTSLSQASASSSINKTSASSRSGQLKSDDEEDFFEDLELPSYFGGRHDGPTSDITPPSSVESKASLSRKADLQSLLNQKLKARVGLHDTLARAAQTAELRPVLRPEPRKKTLSPKYVDKHDERFEDSFIFDDMPPQAVNTRPAAARPSLTSSSSSRSLMNIPSSRSIERISPLPSSSHTLSSRSSSTRSSTTIRPSRSSLNLKEGVTKTASTADSASLNSKNITSWGRTAASTTASSLRPHPSLSNLSGIAASPISAATPRPSTLHRKQSHNTLNESIRTHCTMSSERPSSSMAHYAQPTRASLARHHHHHQHLPFATISRSDSFSRPSTPLTSVFQQQESRIALTSSPSSTANNVGGVFSRRTRPTIASSAKSHKVTGSDPSGRTSASLGMPITSNPSSPLKSMKAISTSRDGMNQHAAITRALYKQPRRTQTLGDGSELDGIDDLPVNREKEKKFVKIPIRRRQSSGMASVDSIRSNITTATMIGNATRGVPVSQQMFTSRRERVDSAPEQMQTFSNKKPSANAITSTKPLNKVSSLLLADDGKAGKTTKRPGLKLIRNLSASGLSRIQGQMKWNPVLLKWEGNESSLRDFDNIIASSARPALISPLGPLSPRNVYSTSPLANLPGSDDQQANTNSIEQKILSISNPHGTTPSLGGVRIVGDMVFDPVKRSWFSTSSEGEEEINFGDDEEEDDGDDQNKTHKIDAWEGGEQARLKTRRSFANDWNSNASSTGDDQQESNWSFAEFSRKQRDADKRHKEEMNAWREAEATQIQTMPDIRKYL